MDRPDIDLPDRVADWTRIDTELYRGLDDPHEISDSAYEMITSDPSPERSWWSMPYFAAASLGNWRLHSTYFVSARATLVQLFKGSGSSRVLPPPCR